MRRAWLVVVTWAAVGCVEELSLLSAREHRARAARLRGAAAARHVAAAEALEAQARAACTAVPPALADELLSPAFVAHVAPLADLRAGKLDGRAIGVTLELTARDGLTAETVTRALVCGIAQRRVTGRVRDDDPLFTPRLDIATSLAPGGYRVEVIARDAGDAAEVVRRFMRLRR